MKDLLNEVVEKKIEKRYVKEELQDISGESTSIREKFEMNE